jgi:hypothetical protein
MNERPTLGTKFVFVGILKTDEEDMQELQKKGAKKLCSFLCSSLLLVLLLQQLVYCLQHYTKLIHKYA